MGVQVNPELWPGRLLREALHQRLQGAQCRPGWYYREPWKHRALEYSVLFVMKATFHFHIPSDGSRRWSHVLTRVQTLPPDRLVLLTLPVCVITTGKSGEDDRKVLISVSLRYRDGPGNKWPNARAAEETINKAIPRVITVPLFLKLTFQNFSLCKPLQRHH